jgi:hypothetical protein
MAALLGVVCATLLASPARAQFIQQGPKLVSSGAGVGVSHGRSVAISADGNTAIVGGPDGSLSIGAAWIWTRDNTGGWAEQAKLVGSGAAASRQGTSVSISADGNTVAVGGPFDTNSIGAVWIWTRASGVWTQAGNKLVGSGATGPAQQGYSLALSADGNTLIVGGIEDGTGVGAAWIWTRNGGIWTQQGAKLIGSGAVGASRQGESVAIAADGNTAIVGGVFDNSLTGAAWVWTRSGGVWNQQGTKLVGSGAGSGLQGQAVSMAADGNTAIVGGYGANGAWVWTRTAGTWTQQGPKLVGSGEVGIASQGSSVSLSADGSRALVGGYQDNAPSSTGATWAWMRSDGVWAQLGPKLVGSGAVGPAQQGLSAALSGDGTTAIVGAPDDNSRTGAFWIFTLAPEPLITIHPAHQTVTSGTTVTFSAAASGTPPPTVQWQISTDAGSTFIDIANATSTTYSLTAAASANGNRYRAVFTNATGSATTNAALLTLSSAPVIVTHPASQNVVFGTTVTFSAAATGIPTPTVQWQVSLDNGVSFGDLGGSTSLNYSFTPIILESGARFRAVFTNSAGSATTNAALLTVSAAINAPAIVSQPSNQSVSAGGVATFTAAATGNPAPAVRWQVSNNGVTYDDVPGATSPTFSFAASTSDNGKQYRAMFTNSAGSAVTFGVLLTVNGVALTAPTITAHPASRSAAPGNTVTFSAAAIGTPDPVAQWQVSTNGGVSFSDIAGATSTVHSFVVAGADDGKRFRAVFSNTAGSTTTSPATLTVSQAVPQPTMALDRTSLKFAAESNGSVFTSSTPPQIVRLSQTGTGTVTWAAASNVPWLVVSPASGMGAATLTISTQFSGGLTASQVGQVTLTFSGAATSSGSVAVGLTTASSSDPVSPPFGSFDTPAGDGTVLAGSVAVTGWTLDDIGVQRVELWRDPQPGETTPPFASTPTDPRGGKVFIANATFVDGSRPDVEALYPSTPANHRAGWGYLMLTPGLWNQGNGTYQLYAFAFDQEDNVATIGTKTIVVNNNTAVKPFGSIDTPGPGAEASGPNFGWALARNIASSRPGVPTGNCRIPPSGVQVSIDSGPLQPVVYGDFRADIAEAFPGFTNSTGAGGHFIFDWSTLSNGLHTIGWFVTDDCNRSDGIGSRFFTVSNGSNLVAAQPVAPSAIRVRETEADAPIMVARGFGELPVLLAPGAAGSRAIEVKQGERVEIRLPHGFDAVHQLAGDGQLRALPVGSTWDPAANLFTWAPGPGFLGRYRLVFSNGHERISLRLYVVP